MIAFTKSDLWLLDFDSGKPVTQGLRAAGFAQGGTLTATGKARLAKVKPHAEVIRGMFTAEATGNKLTTAHRGFGLRT